MRQFSVLRPKTCPNSFVLLVTSIPPSESTVAAIIMSFGPIDSPLDFSSYLILAYSSEASESNGTTSYVEKRTLRSSAFLACELPYTPRRSSPLTMDGILIFPTGVLYIFSARPRSLVLNISIITFVSRKYFIRFSSLCPKTTAVLPAPPWGRSPTSP